MATATNKLTRTEKDSIGTKEIPAQVYYGIQTARAVENYPISGMHAHPSLIRALGMIKEAAAEANLQLGLIDGKRARAIIQAAREVQQGEWNSQFVVDVFQAGAGVSFHMNSNEVIANRAVEILGGELGDYSIVHPNDHVNYGQSTNDVFPTGMRVATLLELEKLYPVLDALATALEEKGKEFHDILKSGRTHMQDAVPMRLGQEFAAYAVDKKLSKYKDEIGQGAIEGVAGQAAADEAAARTSFIPLMSIGIPENAVMALMMAAFIIKGIQPGPNMIGSHPELFWGLVASMWIGNVFLLVLNVPLVRYWLSVFKIPYAVLFPSILFFCCIGTYSVNNSLEDIFITAAFGFMGYMFMRLELDAAPLMLGFILGPMLEENFRRAMLLSRGSFGIFATRPISATLLSLVGVFIVWQVASFLIKVRKNKGAALPPQPVPAMEE